MYVRSRSIVNHCASPWSIRRDAAFCQRTFALPLAGLLLTAQGETAMLP
ncbi:MAG: hypothetical protein KJ065_20675 [Anaerolineae bacterium]|nr:hypothetical protein [Anaerolineae bacterium]